MILTRVTSACVTGTPKGLMTAGIAASVPDGAAATTTMIGVSCLGGGLSCCWRQDPNLTSFQKQVYDALCHVPPGQVVTYKSLAEHIGCRSYQAIGQALRRNPYAPAIPCHRVVKADLTLGGFFGHTSGPKIEEKWTLLRDEGVVMDESTGKIDRQSVYVFC